MKKIYSFVLMAAMLLVGTSAWADDYAIGSTEYTTLQEAIDAATEGQTITLLDNAEIATAVTLDAEKHIILDLGGNLLQFNLDADVDNAACITIKQGVLEIKNGEIENAKRDVRTQLIRVIGTTDAVDAATDPYSQVIVVKGAKLKNTQSNTSLTNNKFNVLEITEKSGTTFSNGARIDVYGEVEAQTYGIKVNGTIKKPAEETSSPYVYIHTGAKVKASATASSAAAAYSSGYARWIIEGECSGSTGLYAKSGDIEISGTITSSNQSTETKTGKGSGIEAGGSAIVIESNKNYDGHIDVTISAGATITATNGYAIEETVDTEVNQTKVEAITIQGGTMSGGAGAIIVDEKTSGTSTEPTHTVTVVGGNINGSIQIEGTTVVAADVTAFLPTGASHTSEEGNDADFLVITTPATTTTQATYSVTPNTAKNITLNANGLATYSFANATAGACRELPDGLKAYVTTGVLENNVLKLTEVEGNIPAGVGVILRGTADQAYVLDLVTTGAATIAENSNKLFAASSWPENQTVDNAYVLVGNELYLYTGKVMKPNKAYLKLDAPANPSAAPARIQMVFAETQDVENVEVEAIKAVKFIENGQVLIKRGETIYNVQGQIVK